MPLTLTLAFQPLQPQPQAAPVITGTVQEGQTLTITKGTWRASQHAETYVGKVYDEDGNVLSTQAFSGSTITYSPASEQIGKALYATVTATNNYGVVTSALSASTSAVIPATPVKPVNTVAPSVTGTPQVGVPLSYDPGTWTNLPNPNFTVNFKVGGVSKGTSYTPVTADVGSTVTVTVTANNGVASDPATSSASAAIISDVAVDAYDFGSYVTNTAYGWIPVGSGVTRSSGTATGITVSGGYIKPSTAGSAPVTAGTVVLSNGRTITLSASSSTIVVNINGASGTQELTDALAYIDGLGAAGSLWTIKIRAGKYTAPLINVPDTNWDGAAVTTINDTAFSFNGYGASWTDYVTIQGEHAPSPATISGGAPEVWFEKISVSSAKYLKFKHIQFGRQKGTLTVPWDSGAGSNGVQTRAPHGNAHVNYAMPVTSSTFVWFEQCLFQSDPTAATNATSMFYLTSGSDITIKKCVFKGIINCVTWLNTTRVAFDHNLFDGCFGNNFFISGALVDSSAIKFNLNRNTKDNPYGLHPDFVQWGNSGLPNGIYSNFDIVGNIMDARTYEQRWQMFFNRMYAGSTTGTPPALGYNSNIFIAGNISVTVQNAFISTGWGDNINIINNVGVSPINDTSATSPSISLSTNKSLGNSGPIASDNYPVTNTLIMGNVSTRLGFNDPNLDFISMRNTVVTQGSQSDLEALFADPTNAATLTAFAPKVSSPLTTVSGNSRATQAGAITDYITHAVWDSNGLVSDGSYDFPHVETGHTATLTSKTSQAVSSLIVSAQQTVSGASSTGTVILVQGSGFSIRVKSALNVDIVSGVQEAVVYNGETWQIEFTTPSFGGSTYSCTYKVGGNTKATYSIGVAAGGAYSETAVTASGDDYLYKVGTIIATAGRKGMFSANFTLSAAGDGAQMDIMNLGAGKVVFRRTSANLLQIILRAAGSTTAVSWLSSATYLGGATTYNWTCSWDGDTGRFQNYINGVAQTVGAIAAVDIAYNQNTGHGILCSKGNTTVPANPVKGTVSMLYFNCTESLDLSVSANLQKFYNAGAVNLGPNGALPTGTQPAILFGTTMTAADWIAGNGLGTITGWTTSGAFA
jgi:hypothetical protein